MDIQELQNALESIEPLAWAAIAVIGVLVLLIGFLIGWSTANRRRARQYQQRFGPEYDRVQRRSGDRASAEAELERREQRVREFDIRTLTPEEHERYSSAWRQIQTRFVDNPAGATEDADRLVEQVMQTRGYPVGDFEQQADDLSVDHPRVVQNYRSAHAIAIRNKRDEADTEELRQALVHYRELFEDLLVTDETAGARAPRTAEAS